MRLNLPKPAITWMKGTLCDWSLQTRGENPIEVAQVTKDGGEWSWCTFWPSTCPDGSTVIESNWSPTLKEAKLRVKESLLRHGVIK